MRPSTSNVNADPGPVQASPEFFVANGDVQLCVQTLGSDRAEPLLLIMGLSGTMNWWDDELCADLVEAGFFVIRYDNRDTGRSTKVNHPATRRALVRGFVGAPSQPPYTLSDMADDAIAILDYLDLDSAHLAGVSMGGMIAQTLAIEHPERVRSLTSIMSTTGRRSVGWQHPKLVSALLRAGEHSRDAYVENSVKWWRRIGSHAFPIPLDRTRRKAEETWDRGVEPEGVLRQMIAIVNQPDRTHDLGNLSIPAVVVHGRHDPMVHCSGGKATAAAIPDAELRLVPGLGHDLPHELFPTFVDAISTAASRARTHSPAQQQT